MKKRDCSLTLTVSWFMRRACSSGLQVKKKKSSLAWFTSNCCRTTAELAAQDVLLPSTGHSRHCKSKQQKKNLILSHLDCPHSRSSRNSSWTWVLVFFSCTNLVSRRSICMRMSSHASHIQVSERCRYCSRVEMWVNLRAILVTSGRQSDNNPVSSWKKKT